jgi:beta-alanine degradation protein BauB
MSKGAIATRLIENERIIVTEWRFPEKGSSTGWHRHAYDYVVVPILNGQLKIITHDSESVAGMTAGVPYFRSAGVEHDVINWTDGEYAFIDIELK